MLSKRFHRRALTELQLLRVPDEEKTRLVYEYFKDELENLWDILLLKKYDEKITEDFLRLCMGDTFHIKAKSKKESIEFVKKCIDYFGESSIRADLYILLHELIKKYTSLRGKVKIKIMNFLVKNMSFGFKDYLRSKYWYFRRLENEGDYEPITMESPPIPMSFLVDGWLPSFGYLKASPLLRYTLYMTCNYNYDYIDVAGKLSVLRHKFMILIKKEIAELNEYYKDSIIY